MLSFPCQLISLKHITCITSLILHSFPFHPQRHPPFPCSKDSLKAWHVASYWKTQKYGLISSHVVKTWTLCERRKDVPTPRCNLKSKIPRQGRRSLSPLVCYDGFRVLTAEVRPCHLGNYTHRFALYQDLHKTSCSGQQGYHRLPSLYFPHHECRRLFLLIREPNFVKMFREKSFKSSSDWIGRHTHTHRRRAART